MPKILFFGPYSPPVTGQSLAFRAIVDSYKPCQYVLVDTTFWRHRISNSLYAVFYSFWLLLTKQEIKIVYFTCTRSTLGALKDLPLLFYADYKKKRIINHLHGGDFKRFYEKAGWLRPLLKKAYKTIDTSIVLTPSMAREFDDFHNMKIVSVANFYPSDFDDVVLPTKQNLEISFLSNLICSKGILDFLKAIKLVAEKRPGITFKIAGRFMGDHIMSATQVEKNVRQFLDSNKNIRLVFEGGLKPEDRYSFLSTSSIFVLPTYYPTEGFPLSIVEAMRCGNVIITTFHNYLSDIVKSENGCLVKPMDVEGIFNSILKYTDDIDLLQKTQNHNRRQAKLKYSQSIYTSKVRQVIDC